MANLPNAPTYSGVDYSWLADLPDQFYKGAQQKQQYDESQAFKGGLPTDANGNVDYNQVAKIMASFGDTKNLGQFGVLGQQQQQLAAAQQLSPLLAGGASPMAAQAPVGQALPPVQPVAPPAPVKSAPLTGNPPASAALSQSTTRHGGGESISALISTAFRGGDKQMSPRI